MLKISIFPRECEEKPCNFLATGTNSSSWYMYLRNTRGQKFTGIVRIAPYNANRGTLIFFGPLAVNDVIRTF